jgi:hypothetical protein
MTTDHITAEQKAASPFFPGFWDNRGWGFGLSVFIRRDDIAGVPGRFGWDGGYGTSAPWTPEKTWSDAVCKEHSALKLVECCGPWRFSASATRRLSSPGSYCLRARYENEGIKKVMADPRLTPDANPMPFDGKRMIYGGFAVAFRRGP